MRETAERELLALILNKNECIDALQVLPKYLSNKELGKLLEYSIECYKKHNVVDPARIMTLHKDFNITLFTDILTNTFYHTNWQDHLINLEEIIVNNYKQDIIKQQNEKLNKGLINYNQFMKAMKKLDEIRLTDKIETLTKIEILENINTENVGIYINNFSKLNNILKLVQGDFLIVGASTGVGKSGFLLNLMSGLMGKYQCIYFNMEMSKSTIYKRLISINTDIPINDINRPSPYQKELMGLALDNIEKSNIIVEHKVHDIHEIKSIVAKQKNKDKHTILFIDHIGLTKSDNKKSLYEQMTEVAKELRQISLDYDCTIISASQLNRSAYGSKDVSITMLKDSGELENSSSKTILIYSEDDNKENLEPLMNIYVAKNRDGEVGIIPMKYYKTKQIFKEVS